METTIECSCSSAGFCNRRQAKIPNLHWSKCRNGQCEVIDKLYRDKAEPRPSQPVVADASTIGTQIRQRIKEETGVELTCGSCLAFLKSLNRTTEHNHEAIVIKLASEVPWPQEWREKNTRRRDVISAMIADIVPLVNRPEPKILASGLSWAVCVNAAPRPVSSLQETIDSILSEGWQDVTVFAEPDTTDAKGASRTIVRPETIAPQIFSDLGPKGRYGAYQNFVQSMADMLLLYPEATAFLYVQDDVKFARGTRQLLERDLWPSQRTGIVSPYCPNFTGYKAETPQLRRINYKNLMGALAYAMPRNAVEEMLALPLVQTWKGGVKQTLTGHNRKALDAFAGHAMAESERKVFFYTHSLCEHFSPRGNSLGNSSVGNGNNVGFRREFLMVKANPVDHFTAPWVTWDCHGEQQFSTPEPETTGPVSVIVPGYGLADLTIDCLQALAKSTISVHLIYVDNGSDEEDFEYIKAFAQSHFEKSICIRNATNKGYTFACNQGLAIAPKNHHVLMLNNDCRVNPDCVKTLTVHLEWHPKTASVAPLTNDKGICSINRAQNRLAAGPTGRRKRVIPLDVLPWFCCMLNRDAVAAVPELPKDAAVSSGLAVDDWWSRQLNAKGWQHLLCCDAFAEHDHSATFKEAGINRRAEQRKAARWLQQHG